VANAPKSFAIRDSLNLADLSYACSQDNSPLNPYCDLQTSLSPLRVTTTAVTQKNTISKETDLSGSLPTIEFSYLGKATDVRGKASTNTKAIFYPRQGRAKRAPTLFVSYS
jgi:hypothetical protein